MAPAPLVVVKSVKLLSHFLANGYLLVKNQSSKSFVQFFIGSLRDLTGSIHVVL